MMFSVLPKVMFSVLPKVSVQSVRSLWFLDVAWSAAFGVALSDAGTSRRQKYKRIKCDFWTNGKIQNNAMYMFGRNGKFNKIQSKHIKLLRKKWKTKTQEYESNSKNTKYKRKCKPKFSKIQSTKNTNTKSKKIWKQKNTK